MSCHLLTESYNYKQKTSISQPSRSRLCVYRHGEPGRLTHGCVLQWVNITIVPLYRCADKSLARPTSRCILFDGENISFDASLVIQGASVNRAILQHCFFLVRQHWGGSRYHHSADSFKAF